MYAIVDIAGKQYKVSEGNKLKVATISQEVGSTINFGTVLLTDSGETVNVGTPFIKGSNVSAKVIEHGRDRKILVYKKKRRKGYQRKNGHRQGFTLLEIKNITMSYSFSIVCLSSHRLVFHSFIV